MNRLQRIAVWIAGAVAANWMHSEALASTDYVMPDDMLRKLLLTAPIAAAAMVGGSFAVLLCDRLRRR